MVIVIVLLLILAGPTVIAMCMMHRATADRRTAAYRLKALHRLEKAAAREERNLDRLEQCARLSRLQGMLQGIKCKGCGVVKERDDLKEIGEDPGGRPISLCASCRNAMGMVVSLTVLPCPVMSNWKACTSS